MTDFRSDIRLYFSIFGKTYKQRMDINYSPNDDGIDNRIIEWFRNCWDDAEAHYHRLCYECDKERIEAETRENELKELARLKEKYENQ